MENESSKVFDRCSHDEADALWQLEIEWPQLASPDGIACFVEAAVAGFASYVELVICLEMVTDVRNVKTNSGGQLGAQSTRPAPPEMSVVDKHE